MQLYIPILFENLISEKFLKEKMQKVIRIFVFFYDIHAVRNLDFSYLHLYYIPTLEHYIKKPGICT